MLPVTAASVACCQHFARHTQHGRVMVLDPATGIVFADAIQLLPLLTLSSASSHAGQLWYIPIRRGHETSALPAEPIHKWSSCEAKQSAAWTGAVQQPGQHVGI